MQTHDLPVLECKCCHYRTIRAIKQCPVCHQADFHTAKLRSNQQILQEAFALHASQSLRMSLLASFFAPPWSETLQELAAAQRELAEGLEYHGEPGEEIEAILQQAITAEFRDLPRLANQAAIAGESELAIQLKWLAARQGDIVAQLGKLRKVMQTPQIL